MPPTVPVIADDSQCGHTNGTILDDRFCCIFWDGIPTIQNREYQQKGIEFLQSRKRALLTDAPGMGKTPQAVLAAETPVLIAAPKYLCGQWYTWMREHLPNENVVLAAGGYSPKKKTEALLQQADWTIINHDMSRTHFDVLKDLSYKTVIVDESHHYRNREAERTRAMLQLTKSDSIEYLFLLTATPIWKEADDLWAQLNMLHPDVFDSYSHFVSTFCVTDQGRFGPKVMGLKKHMLKELEEVLGFFRLGRTYKDVGRAIPPLIEKVVRVEMPNNIERLYREVEGYWIEEIELGFNNYAQVIQALRQVSSGPHKVKAIQEILEDMVPLNQGGTPAIIFAWHRDTAESIGRAIGAHVITGAMNERERRRLAKDRTHHVVATIASLSEGIDLSHSRTVIFAEEHWPPGSNTQALSRVHRERQNESNDEPVIVYYVHSENTVDEHIHAVAQRRSATIRELMEAARLIRV